MADEWTIEIWTGNRWALVIAVASRLIGETKLTQLGKTDTGRYRLLTPHGRAVMHRGIVRSYAEARCSR